LKQHSPEPAGALGHPFRRRLVGSGAVLSALSFALVLYSASAEPFIVF